MSTDSHAATDTDTDADANPDSDDEDTPEAYWEDPPPIGINHPTANPYPDDATTDSDTTADN